MELLHHRLDAIESKLDKLMRVVVDIGRHLAEEEPAAQVAIDDKLRVSVSELEAVLDAAPPPPV